MNHLLTSMLAGFTILFLFLCLPAAAQIETRPVREGLRLGMELGAASVRRTRFDTDVDDTNFYLGFFGGYWIGRHVLAGLELNGWLLEASNLNDPSVGEGISRVFAFARIYPSTNHGWFLKAAGGYASYWNHRPGEPTGGSGEGFELGGGYDFALKRFEDSLLLTPFAMYGSGTIGNVGHEALTVGLGFHYQF